MATKLSLYTGQSTTGFLSEQFYGALDTIATLEIDNVLDQHMKPEDRRTMNFYLGVQAPALAMTVRGIKVDQSAREAKVAALQKDLRRVERDLAKHPDIKPIWDKTELNSGACAAPKRKDGKHSWPRGVPDSAEKRCEACGASRLKIRPFKPSSDDDLKHLFYDLWKLKVITNKDGRVTTDKEAREKLRERSKPHAATIALIDEFAKIKKKLEFLAFNAPDGRFHAGFNIGVTSTHRWSSNKDAFQRGSNAQNITEELRYIFTADDGYELCYADLKQAESNVIAHVAGDEGYIEAHAMGDTHTYVTRLVWPEGINGQEWNWDDIKIDKAIATSARPAWDDRDGHDYRFQAKAVQHGSNLGLTAFGLAIQKRIPVEAAREAQRRYFKAFPGIRNYQNMIRERVENQEPIINPLGVRFKLFGRPWDEGTYKEGLAVTPQSTVGHIVSIGVRRIWDNLPKVQLLAQVHDAILFQFPKGRYDLVYDALEAMTVPVPITGVDGKTRVVTIGTEAAVGRNWGHATADNPEGIREITFTDRDTYKIKEH